MPTTWDANQVYAAFGPLIPAEPTQSAVERDLREKCLPVAQYLHGIDAPPEAFEALRTALLVAIGE